MIQRVYEPPLHRLLRAFPIVTILGPRQCGKTTLAREALKGYRYVDLERPADLAPLEADPEARLRQLGKRVIIDEAQRLPSIFPIIRSIVDEQRGRKGQFVLLGSASLSLIQHISETLAGRTAFIDLSPFRWRELSRPGNRRDLEKLWLRGGYPDAWLQNDASIRSAWYEAYIRTFIERDLPAMGISVSASSMRRLWAMLAHCNGGIWKASELASSMGVSYHTINRYVDILEQTFLLRRLQPYFVNLGKRLIKSPKVYYRDTGLLHYFLGITSLDALHTHPAAGSSWEGFVVDQIITMWQLADPSARFSYWRTATGVEVDLLVETGGTIIPIEIKRHSSPDARLADPLVRCMTDLSLKRGYVVYPGEQDYSLGRNVTAVPAVSAIKQPNRVFRAYPSAGGSATPA